ncbi:sugar ABC transporter substrate-binding protein [Streptomyces sp. 150FB]|uniref:ABC transporter substrate-binding protein n=1 Tax=Streptomyces sp. 150FB TaxID=1576605 RepID=UPI0005892B3F|nr:extracellular solute-binding protein [Streptomyces sp. 150FB]KIF76883.1 sugar ABC transporter substrate-binding protein [Streptomyces sp. 150FB]
MTASVTSRRTVLAGIAALVGGTAVGCGTSGPSRGGAAGGGKGASVWIISGVTEKAFQNSFDTWNKTHAKQQISVQSFANDPYKQKIRTAVGAGQSPTLIYGWGGGVLNSYVQAGSVEDLSDLAADPELKGRFLPSIAKVGTVGGKTYAVPNNGVKPVMVYYNKDLFAKISAQPPKSWGELMALVPKFKKAGIAPFTVSGQAKWPLLPWLSYLMDRIGGPAVMNDILAGKSGSWSHPAVIQANEMIQQLVKAGGFVKGFASISTDSGADIALMYTGKAAMSLGLPATYQTIQTADPKFITDGKLGYFPFPTVEGGKGDPANVAGNPSNYWSVSSSASAAEKAAARAYIKSDLLNKAYAADLLKVGNVPPVAGLEPQLASTSDAAYFRAIYELASKAPNFALSLDQALSPQQGDAVLTALQQIFLNEISPKKFASTMNATISA